MYSIIDKIEDVLDWLISAVKRIKKWLIRIQEERIRNQIEKLVTKLWRISAIYKCNVHDLKYIEKYDAQVHQYYWIVDYHDKYIFGMKE